MEPVDCDTMSASGSDPEADVRRNFYELCLNRRTSVEECDKFIKSNFLSETFQASDESVFWDDTDQRYALVCGFKCACSCGNLKIAKFLYKYSKTEIAGIPEYVFVFAHACSNGHLKVAKWIYGRIHAYYGKYYGALIDEALKADKDGLSTACSKIECDVLRKTEGPCRAVEAEICDKTNHIIHCINRCEGILDDGYCRARKNGHTNTVKWIRRIWAGAARYDESNPDKWSLFRLRDGYKYIVDTIEVCIQKTEAYISEPDPFDYWTDDNDDSDCADLYLHDPCDACREYTCECGAED